MDSIQTICVCGAGTMGSGIAQLCAQSGIPTTLYDLDTSKVQKSKATIEKNWVSAIEKGKLSPSETEKATGLLKFTSNITECVAYLIIEAIVEKEQVKVSLFKELEFLNKGECIFASNTSSLSVTAIAEQLSNKERVIGLHFFNPAPLMRLIEVVKTKYNPTAIVDTMVTLAKRLGKTPVVCKDAPGFIVNHVARPYYIEALNLVSAGFGDFETIDSLMESSGFKMGPFRLMDLIGNDINYAVSCSVYEAMGKPERLKPSPIQKDKVDKGELGRKTKKGYYSY